MSVLKQLLGAPAHDVGSLSEQGELYVFRVKEFSQLVLENQKDNVTRYNDILDQLLKVAKRIEEWFSAIEQDVSLLKKAIVGQGSCVGGQKSKLKVPEPKKFDGSQNAKELENFLWDME